MENKRELKKPNKLFISSTNNLCSAFLITAVGREVTGVPLPQIFAAQFCFSKYIF